jgi:hypothetical protein
MVWLCLLLGLFYGLPRTPHFHAMGKIRKNNKICVRKEIKKEK